MEKHTFNPETRIYGILYACTTAIFWGFLAIAIKLTTYKVEPILIVWFRFLFAFLCLFIYFSVKDPIKLSIFRRPPLLLIIATIGLAINYYGFATGINRTSPGTAQIFIQTGPLLLALSGIFIFGERLNIRQGIGFLLAICGFVAFYRDQLSFQGSDSSNFDTGIIWLLTAAVSWLVYSLIQKVLVRTYHTQQMNMIVYGLPLLLYLPWVDFSQVAHFTTGTWLLLIFLGANTLIAYGSLTEALKYVEANKISMIITVNPIITWAVMLMLDFFDVDWIEAEKFTILGGLGALLVLCGALMVIIPKKMKTLSKN